jgi:two-component sensor histidine kinase/CheY-like chemotaxis protein
VFDTGHLASLYPEAVLHAEKAAGMLAIPISDVPRDYILLFRRERLHATTWAGNPQKAVALADDGLRLSPRKSFAAFTSISHGRSLPFTDENRRTARALRAALVELTLGFSRYREETHVKTVQRQELLIAELNHRIRNIIGLIRGLISQSGIHTDKVSEYVQSLDGRIQSLARAHDQITRENWNPARVSELLDREISAYVPEQLERFTRLGPEVLVRPQAFSTLSLVVHELVTNAAKYGSLSRHGSVAVTTEIRAGLGLYINWREIDGPPVQAPRRRGFGSVILERLVPFDLGGTAQIRYEPGGLEADFFIPSAHIVEAAALMGSDGGQSDLAPVVSVDQPHNRPLEGMSVLLLEDNLILALETEDLLHHFGAKVVFLASSIDAASQILKSQRLDFALLDLYIGAHTSLEFALSVRASQIPFIFATGYGENADLSLFHPPPAIVTKPYGRLVANSVIAQVLRARPMRRSGDATDQEAPLSSDEAVRHDNSGK